MGFGRDGFGLRLCFNGWRECDISSFGKHGARVGIALFNA